MKAKDEPLKKQTKTKKQNTKTSLPALEFSVILTFTAAFRTGASNISVREDTNKSLFTQ